MVSRRALVLLSPLALAAPAVLRAQPVVDHEMIVVGAGAAGLAAARHLSELGYDALVLEARSRVGGRAWTVTEPLGLPWDMGAQWLHMADRNPLVPLARRAGTDLQFSQFDDMRIVSDQVPLPPDPATALLDGYDQAVRQMGRRVRGASSDQPLSSVATHSIWDRAALELMALSMAGTPAQISLADAWELESGDDMLASAGFGTLVAQQAVGLRVRLESRVDRIDRTAAGSLAVEGAFGTLRARAVVLTLPPAMLASGAVALHPGWPDWKRTAWSHLPAGELLKIGVRFQRRGPDWPEYGVDLDAVTAGAGALLHLFPGRPIGTILISGAPARSLSEGGTQSIRAATERIVSRILGRDAAAQVDSITWHDWSADPFSRGVYTRASIGAGDAREVAMYPIEDRIFFAGEAAPGPMATTVGGAWQSGRAAARNAANYLQGG